MPGRGEFEQESRFPDSSRTIAAADGPARPAGETTANDGFFGQDGLTFADLLDILNPLQHIPLIGDIYRAITDDRISTGARLAGGALYGGPLGLLGALANTAVEEATGQDIGGNVLALFSDDNEADGAVLTAEAAPAKAEITLASAEPNPARAAEVRSTAGSAAPLADLKQPVNLPPPSYWGLTASASPIPRPQATAGSQSLVNFSPAAFQSLLNGVNREPRQANPQGLTAGGEIPPVYKDTIRDAGLEINRLLRPHAKQQN